MNKLLATNQRCEGSQLEKNKCRFFSQFFNIGFTNIPGLCIFVGFTNKYIHTALVHIFSLFSNFAVRINGGFLVTNLGSFSVKISFSIYKSLINQIWGNLMDREFEH